MRMTHRPPMPRRATNLSLSADVLDAAASGVECREGPGMGGAPCQAHRKLAGGASRIPVEGRQPTRVHLRSAPSVVARDHRRDAPIPPLGDCHLIPPLGDCHLIPPLGDCHLGARGASARGRSRRRAAAAPAGAGGAKHALPRQSIEGDQERRRGARGHEWRSARAGELESEPSRASERGAGEDGARDAISTGEDGA
jgi:hypothetical protein